MNIQNIVKKIVFERKKKKLTQQKIATMTGTSRSKVAAVEMGRFKSVDEIWLRKFADIVGKDPEYFINDKVEFTPDYNSPMVVAINSTNDPYVAEKKKQIENCYRALEKGEVTDRMERLRIANNISQHQFSVIGDFNYSSYNKVSLHLQPPNMKHIITAAYLFNVSLDYLIRNISIIEETNVDGMKESLKKELSMKDKIIESMSETISSQKMIIEMIKSAKEKP
jgi:transcriptional regulator with XRE-family HTH domain